LDFGRGFNHPHRRGTAAIRIFIVASGLFGISVCEKYWPDFDENDLDAALAEYASRQRRFGK